MRGRVTHAAVRIASLVAIGLSVIVGAGYAYWTAHGTGTGVGTAAGALAITLNPGVPTGQLYPGGQTDVALTISNPNAFAGHIGSLSLASAQGTNGFTVDPSHAACGVTALSFTTQTNGGAGWTVPARVGGTNGSLTVDLAGALSMSAVAANACQGASFTTFLSAGA